MVKSVLAGAVLALSLSTSAQAGVLFAFEETSEGVFGTLSGSLITENAVTGGIGGIGGSWVGPSTGQIRSAGFSISSVDSYRIDGPTFFGSGAITSATGRSGDLFQIGTLGEVSLPDGYVSGTELSGTLDFAGATFDSLGIDAGIYTWNLIQTDPIESAPQQVSAFAPESANDSPFSITVTFGVASDPEVVPLPAGLPLLLAGLGGFALLRRRKAAARSLQG